MSSNPSELNAQSPAHYRPLPESQPAAESVADPLPPPPPIERRSGFASSRPRAFVTSLFIIALTGLLSSLAIVTFPLAPRGGIYHWLAQRWPRIIFRFGGVRLRTAVSPQLQRSESYLYLSNHESLTDILALLAGLPQTVVMVAKRSLLILPIFSWGMWLAGFVFINRKNRMAAYRSMQRAGRRLRRGRSVVVFPEGTRGDGGALLSFKRGSFLLSLAAQIPVVPVGIYGTRSVLPRDHFCVYPGSIAVCVGAPIAAPKSADQLPEFIALVRREVDRLRVAARALAEEAP